MNATLRVYKQSLRAADNARLAILKQGEIVLVLGNISSMLAMGLRGQMDPPRNARTPEPSDEAC